MQFTTTERKTINKALRIISSKMLTTPFITSSADTREYLTLNLATQLSEVFVVIFLSNQHQVIAMDEMFRGTIDAAAVYPREVVRAALTHNAAAVIFAHNHPSGIAEPSQADISITRKLKSALELIDVRTLDHVIVGGKHTTSLAERGLL
jgi:DNA repair protein RadC